MAGVVGVGEVGGFWVCLVEPFFYYGFVVSVVPGLCWV